MNGLTVVIVVALIVFVFVLVNSCNRSSFAFDNSMYQEDPPSVDLQENYFKCIAKECGGNTHDYDCLEVSILIRLRPLLRHVVLLHCEFVKSSFFRC